jgi:hypothetical protein
VSAFALSKKGADTRSGHEGAFQTSDNTRRPVNRQPFSAGSIVIPIQDTRLLGPDRSGQTERFERNHRASMEAAKTVMTAVLILIATAGTHLRPVAARKIVELVRHQNAGEQEQRNECGNPGKKPGAGKRHSREHIRRDGRVNGRVR